MTHTVNPKSTRRNAVIVANAYALPSYMTPDLEVRLGADMAETARREGHIAKMPPDMTRRLAMGRHSTGSRSMTPHRAGEAAGAQVGDFPPADTSEQTCPSGGPLRGMRRKQPRPPMENAAGAGEAKDLAAIRIGYPPNAAEMRQRRAQEKAPARGRTQPGQINRGSSGDSHRTR